MRRAWRCRMDTPVPTAVLRRLRRVQGAELFGCCVAPKLFLGAGGREAIPSTHNCWLYSGGCSRCGKRRGHDGVCEAPCSGMSRLGRWWSRECVELEVSLCFVRASLGVWKPKRWTDGCSFGVRRVPRTSPAQAAIEPGFTERVLSAFR